MPAFDPAYTPTRGMGRIAETFRTFPGVLRSATRPSLSPPGGKHAEVVTAGHALAYCLGETSPWRAFMIWKPGSCFWAQDTTTTPLSTCPNTARRAHPYLRGCAGLRKRRPDLENLRGYRGQFDRIQRYRRGLRMVWPGHPQRGRQRAGPSFPDPPGSGLRHPLAGKESKKRIEGESRKESTGQRGDWAIGIPGCPAQRA